MLEKCLLVFYMMIHNGCCLTIDCACVVSDEMLGKYILPSSLGWPLVIRIALGVALARGLSCLHHSLHMAHVSTSSDPILLGNNFGRAIFVNHDLGQNRSLRMMSTTLGNFPFFFFFLELLRGNSCYSLLRSLCGMKSAVQIWNVLYQSISCTSAFDVAVKFDYCMSILCSIIACSCHYIFEIELLDSLCFSNLEGRGIDRNCIS